MRKIFFLFISLLLFLNKNYAQQYSGTGLSPKDSLEMLQELMNLLDSADRPTSYAFVNFGIGNRLFSIRNNALNAKQNTTNTVIYSPSVGYFHKSGFSISAATNLLNDGVGFGANQFSVTPAFDLSGNKNIDIGLSYSHYFVKDNTILFLHLFRMIFLPISSIKIPGCSRVFLLVIQRVNIKRPSIGIL